jgi:hypothetical protein
MARPRGPLPPRVYWVRRALVLLLALGLVYGVAHVLGRPAGDGERVRVVGGDPGPSALSTADARPGDGAATDLPRRGGSEGPEPSRTPTPLAQPTGPCRNKEVVVTPKLRDDAHAGRVVHLRLKLTTTKTPACTWTVSPESLVVKITSGSDRIWSSQDCPDAVPQTDLVVRKDVPAMVDMGWRGQRSDSTCTRQPDWAQPGFYHVQTAAYGAEPTDVQFELEPPVVPTRTAKPKPDKGDKKRQDDEKRHGRPNPSARR